jgi:SAM-dependent methyltransferase
LLQVHDPEESIEHILKSGKKLINADSNTKILRCSCDQVKPTHQKNKNNLKQLRISIALFSEIFEPGSLLRSTGFNLKIYSEDLVFEGKNLSMDQNDLASLPRIHQDSTLINQFKDLVTKNLSNRRPKILDIGGRARSGVSIKSEWSDWADVTVLDIVDEPDVDICADAHKISEYFDRNMFDAIISISVFEHLAYPMKVVIESEKVLKEGGYFLVHSHQTIGMHDVPWDFWRFSDSAYRALFCNSTGFEVVKTLMDGLMHITPFYFSDKYLLHENAAGFESSSVIARKTHNNIFNIESINGDSPMLINNYPRG